jgi:hypothetical protein
VEIWSILTNRRIGTFDLLDYGELFPSYDGRKLAVFGDLVAVYDLVSDGQETAILRKSFLRTDGLWSAKAYAPDGSRIAVASRHALKVWELPSGKELVSLQLAGLLNQHPPNEHRLVELPLQFAQRIRFSPDGTTLVLAGVSLKGKANPEAAKAGVVSAQWRHLLLDTDVGVVRTGLPGDLMFGIGESVVFSPDGEILVMVGFVRSGPAFEVWNLAALRKQAYVVPGYQGCCGDSLMMRSWVCQCAALSPENKMLAVLLRNGMGDSAVLLWDVDAEREITRLALPAPSKRSWSYDPSRAGLSFSRDGERLTVFCKCYSANFWPSIYTEGVEVFSWDLSSGLKSTEAPTMRED